MPALTIRCEPSQILVYARYIVSGVSHELNRETDHSDVGWAQLKLAPSSHHYHRSSGILFVSSASPEFARNPPGARRMATREATS